MLTKPFIESNHILVLFGRISTHADRGRDGSTEGGLGDFGRETYPPGGRTGEAAKD